MKKLDSAFILIIGLLVFCTFETNAQQEKFGWRLGIYGGEMSYFGDLTDKFRLVQPTSKNINPFDNINFEKYGITAEKSLSKAWGLGLMYSKGHFTSNDRSIDWEGKIRKDNENFSRSLNVLTNLKNYSAYLTYYFDNEMLLSKSALLAPYLKAGLGICKFDVFGDLYSGGNRYFYWTDGTVRNLAEGDPKAEVIKQDEDYESNLSILRTEGKEYRTTVVTPAAGLGLKMRLSSRFNINFEYLFQFTRTDYLDDISERFLPDYTSSKQEYAANPAGIQTEFRGNPNGKDDFYTFATLSVHYNFGRKRDAYFAPVIMTGSLPLFEEGISPLTGVSIRPKTQKAAQREELAQSGATVPEEVKVKTQVDKTTESVETPIQSSAKAEAKVDARINQDSKQDSVKVVSQPKTTQSEKVEETSIEKKPGPKETAGKADSAVATIPVQIILDTVKAAIKQAPVEDKKEIAPAPKDSTDKVKKSEAPIAQPVPSPRPTSLLPGPSDVVVALRKELLEIKSMLAEREKQSEQPSEVEELKGQIERMQRYEEQLERFNERRDEIRYNELKASIDALAIELRLKSLQQPIAVVQPVATPEKDEQISALSNQMAEMSKMLDSLRTQKAAPANIELAQPQPGDSIMQALLLQITALQTQMQENEKRQKEKAAAELKAAQEKKLAEELRKKELADIEKAAAEAEQLRLAEQKIKEDAAKAEMARKAAELTVIKGKIKGFEKSIVYFNTGSSELSSKGLTTVQEISKLMLIHQPLVASLQGFTDKSGSPQRNLELSSRRANAVLQIFEQLGISSDRISIEEGGIDYNVRRPEDGRRVEIKLFIKESN